MSDQIADQPVLSFRDLSYSFLNGGFALTGISGDLYAGEHTVLIGVSGSGKSTLMALAAALLGPNHGQILLHNEPVPGPDQRLVPGHESIVLMRQQPEFSLGMTCRQLLMQHLRAYERTWAEAETLRLLKLCGLYHFQDRLPNTMSGGEQQRLALAIALSTHPAVLLLDEPLSKIDPYQKAQLAADLKQIAAEEGVACLWVLHEPELAILIADQIWVMQHGSIVQQGDTETVYFCPQTLSIGELLGPINQLPAHLWDRFPKAKAQGGFLRPSQVPITSDMPVLRTQFLGLYTLVWVEVDGVEVVGSLNPKPAP